MDQKSANAPAPRPENRRGARDAFVLIAMQLVSAAVGFAAFRQLGLGLPMACVTGITVFATMLAIHMVVRRNQAVAALEAEIAGLKGQIASMSRGVPRGPGAPPLDQRMAAQTAPSPPSAPSLPATMPLRDASLNTGVAGAGQASDMSVPVPNPDTRLDRTTSSMPAQPQQGARGVPSVVQEMRARPTMQAAFPDRGAPPPVPPASLGQDKTQRARPSASSGEEPGDELNASARQRPSRIPPPSPPELPQSNLAKPATPAALPSMSVATKPGPDRKDVAVERFDMDRAEPAPVPQQPPPAPQPLETRGFAQSPAEMKSEQASAEAKMAPYWALRPGDMVAPHLPLPQANPKPSAAAVSLSASSPPVSPRPAVAATRPSPPAAVPASASKAAPDLDSMQQLIDQLAVQLRSPAVKAAAVTGTPPPPGQASDTAAAALGQSIAALRRTADTMRQPTGKSGATADAASPYARLAIVAEAVAADRIDLYLDPILTLDERKTRHFEVSVRLRSDDGLEYAADDLAGAIAGTGLLARIDAAKLTRTAAVADRLTQRGTGASLFANLSGESLADNTFLDVFADTFVEQGPLCARLVLCFAQSDLRGFGDAQWEAVATMAELGFRFALEHVTDLDLDFEELRAAGFEFVKLDASVFLEGLPADNGEIVPSADICRHMSDIGLGLIVGGIVEERDLARIMGFGVLFGQGALFGAPRAVSLDRSQRAA